MSVHEKHESVLVIYVQKAFYHYVRLWRHLPVAPSYCWAWRHLFSDSRRLDERSTCPPCKQENSV